MLYRPTPPFLLACILVLSAVPLFAQRGRISGGQVPTASQLTVRVIGVDDHRMGNAPFQIQLLNSGGVPIQMGFADSTGTARFGSIGAGSYRVRVTGADIEEATNDFEIMPGETFHTETVRVRALASPSAQAGGTAAATVSAADLQAPDKAKKELAKGNDAIAHQQMNKAMEHYRKAIAVYPRYVAALNNLGVACMQLNDFACGRESFEKAIEVDPNLARAYLNLARITLRQHDFAKTETLLYKAVGVEPLNPEALTMLAISELMQGKFDDAIAHARKVHTVAHAGWGLAHLVAAQALEARKLPREAVAEYDLFVKEAPDNPNVDKARAAMARLSAASAGQETQVPR